MPCSVEVDYVCRFAQTLCHAPLLPVGEVIPVREGALRKTRTGQNPSLFIFLACTYVTFLIREQLCRLPRALLTLYVHPWR